MKDTRRHPDSFVLLFRAATDIEAGRFEGRVEHVASGRQARFHSVAELRTFIEQALRADRTEAADAEPQAEPSPGGR
jgi:hypothetical protein